MVQENYYLITALPSLGELGSPPAMTNRQLLDHLAPARRAHAAVEAMVLGDDLLQREALSAGEVTSTSPAVLTVAQMAGDEPLPPQLALEHHGQAQRRVGADATWEAYFRHVAQTGKTTGNRFLAAWVGHEAALRNALATRRAEKLGLDPGDYTVATDLADAQTDLSQPLDAWSAAPDPLAGEQVLDRARWAWLHDNDRWFSFADDELAAYAAKLMLLQRWQRITGQPAQGRSRNAGAASGSQP